mgnify:FL=1
MQLHGAVFHQTEIVEVYRHRNRAESINRGVFGGTAKIVPVWFGRPVHKRGAK